MEKKHDASQSKDKSGHAEKLKDMQPSERILHAAAVLLSANARLGETITQAMERGADQDSPVMMAIPLGIAMDITNAMGEAVEILEEHKLVSRDEIQAFVEKKRAEAKAAMKEAGADDDVCPGCGQVHDDDEESPIRGVADVLARMFMSHMMERATGASRPNMDEADVAPEGVTKH